MTERTPGPWVVRKSGVPGGHIGIEGDFADYHDFATVAVTSSHSLINSDEALANAEFIVTAVNSHDTLTAEVGRLKEALEKSDRLFGHIMEELSLNDGDAAHAYARTGQQISRAALSGISTGRDPKDNDGDTMTDDQVKHMVSRFLTWRLPEPFRPDAGISFKAEYNEHTPWPMKHEPIGTNLFSAEQATAMVRHMLEGLPGSTGRDPIADAVAKENEGE